MNGRTAKKLREVARGLTVSKRLFAYRRLNCQGQIVMDPQSTRGVYKAMKKKFKRGAV